MTSTGNVTWWRGWEIINMFCLAIVLSADYASTHLVVNGVTIAGTRPVGGGSESFYISPQFFNTVMQLAWACKGSNRGLSSSSCYGFHIRTQLYFSKLWVLVCFKSLASISHSNSLDKIIRTRTSKCIKKKKKGNQQMWLALAIWWDCYIGAPTSLILNLKQSSSKTWKHREKDR